MSPPEFSRSRKNVQMCSSSTEQPGASMLHGWDGNWGSMMSSGIIVYPLTRLSLQEGNRRCCTNIPGNLLRMKLWTHMKHTRMTYETYIYKKGRQTHIWTYINTYAPHLDINQHICTNAESNARICNTRRMACKGKAHIFELMFPDSSSKIEYGTLFPYILFL